MWNLGNGDGSDISDVLHGEPYAGKLHVAPLLCYGVTGRFDEVAGLDCPENDIIFGTAMAEKRLENGKVRYSAAYPMGAERFCVSLEFVHGV